MRIADDPAGLAASLRPALLRVSRRIRRQREDEALPLPQLSALYTLAARGPLTAGDLARVEKVQPPSLTKVLAGLEQRGLIVRNSGPKDARHVYAHVTSAGHDLLHADRKLVDAWMITKLAKLSADELRILGRTVSLFEALARD